MPKNISWRKFIQKFHRLRFTGPYPGGKHLIMVKGDVTVHIPNPHSSDISKELVKEILRQANITATEWDEA